MTTICIVRHGQTDRNKAKIIQGRGNFDLNEVGHRMPRIAACPIFSYVHSSEPFPEIPESLWAQADRWHLRAEQ